MVIIVGVVSGGVETYYHVNLTGAFICTQAVFKHMRRTGAEK
jgi:NAD(P)-dependent dehydrogenase (short-subunit alcohol dehydrogenase family)